jgi:ParB-like chromosome segregation protein Spo0J
MRQKRTTKKQAAGARMPMRDVSPEQLDLSLARFRLISSVSVERMKHSLQQHGQISPLIAAIQDDGTLCLLDGFKRHRAALQLGLMSVTVEVMRLSASSMKAQVYLRNRSSGFELVEECLLIAELHRIDGLSQVAIGDLLQRHKSWVCRRLQVMERISPWLFEEVRLGFLQPGIVRKLALLPRGNQEDVAVAVKRHRLGVKETERLIRLYLTAPSDTARRTLLGAPREVLAQLLLPSRCPLTLPPELKQVWHGLQVICTICQRIKNILDRLSTRTGTVFQTQLKEVCHQASTSLAEVTHVLISHPDKEDSHVRQ